MNAGQVLPFLVLLPLVGALASFLLPRRARGIGLLVLLLLAAPVGWCVHQVFHLGPAVHAAGGWDVPLGIGLRMDGTSALMLSITWVIGLAVSVHAFTYFGRKAEAPLFWPLWLFLLTGLNALFLSRDIFNLYVTLELVGIAAVALVALPGTRDALVAAMRYLLVSLSGSLFYLLGVALLYAEYSTVDLLLLQERASLSLITLAAIALMTGGLVMKAALFPLHFWLPPAHANAPAPVSALLSALVVKGSFFILLRLWAEVYGEILPSSAGLLLGVLGGTAVIWGSIQALVQERLKLLIAYSTVAQLGYLFLFFPLFMQENRPLAAWVGCFYFLAAHACAKTAMFLAAGNIMHAAGHDRIRDLGPSIHVTPLSMAAFGLAGVSIIGLPPSGGFLGKWMMLNAAFGSDQWIWIAVIAVGGLLAAGYVLRVVSVMFAKVEPDQAARRVPRTMEWSALFLATAAVLLGLASALPIELISLHAPTPDTILLRGGLDP